MSIRRWVRICKLAAACAAVFGAGLAARGALVGVNFVGGQSGTTASDLTKGGALVTGTAGAVPQGNWNNELLSQQTTAVSILDSTGGTAGSLSYTAPNNWAATGT